MCIGSQSDENNYECSFLKRVCTSTLLFLVSENITEDGVKVMSDVDNGEKYHEVLACEFDMGVALMNS